MNNTSFYLYSHAMLSLLRKNMLQNYICLLKIISKTDFIGTTYNSIKEQDKKNKIKSFN